MPHIDLTQMKAGQRGSVVAIQGGHGMRARLESMGIRPGVMLTKLSTQFMRGPITVRVGTAHIAIGFGMARRVIVTPEPE
ncbi:MAG: ferrous iron transport protein A [candidate division WOR-3 bacterium]|nr:MAG: ferrous iron transport protein A [candidate division WOR-3 bacterium]